MPNFDFVKSTDVKNTFRVKSIKGTFDIDKDKVSHVFKGNLDIEDKEWNIGVIVGSSGTGKTSIAKQCFGEFDIHKYSSGAIIDDMPKTSSVNDIAKMFNSVGFGSPVSWLKPYNVLSNGEKMRVDLARSLMSEKEIILFDEYTSVVDRDVAKIGSYATQKAIRKKGKKFIAVSCHFDIVEWLEPDWIYNTDEERFFFVRKNTKDQKLIYRYSTLSITQARSKEFGMPLGNIII